MRFDPPLPRPISSCPSESTTVGDIIEGSRRPVGWRWKPFGFHAHDVGRRLPSMMSPTVVLRDGELEAGLGSGGSNRIRSAILQTVVRLVCDDLPLEEAVFAPRVHFEDGAVQAEPGVGDAALAELERRGYEIVRWSERNVFFGGVHAVARDPATGQLEGAGDPRRGGAVAVA
jgi:gamma-glutamyltranspeptidase/glutathione hydrolase